MKAPITIIVPVYNREHLVLDTLDSIKAQTFRPLSVIVVDNNSTDNTLEAVYWWVQDNTGPDDPEFQVTVLSEPKPGAPAARNTGMAAAEAEWLMFFDSDDLMQPTHVADAMECAYHNPGAEIVGWDVRYHDLKGNTSILPFTTIDPIYHCIMHGNMATQRYMVRYTLIEMAGGWDEEVQVWNDIELGTRLLFMPDVGIVKRRTPITVDVYAQIDSITGTNYSDKAREMEHSIDCMAWNLTPPYRPMINLKRTALAACCRREGNRKEAHRLLRLALAETPELYRRVLLRLAYIYTSKGIRGVSRIFKPFFNFRIP